YETSLMKPIINVLIFIALAATLAGAERLPEVATPENYKLTFAPDFDKSTFEGDETISIRVLKSTSEITLNALEIDFHDVTVTSGDATQHATVKPDKEKEMVVLSVETPLAVG